MDKLNIGTGLPVPQVPQPVQPPPPPEMWEIRLKARQFIKGDEYDYCFRCGSNYYLLRGDRTYMSAPSTILTLKCLRPQLQIIEIQCQ